MQGIYYLVHTGMTVSVQTVYCLIYLSMQEKLQNLP